MGLDLSIYETTKRAYLSDFKIDGNFASKEIAYWGKNYKLLDFMESLYRRKGGEGNLNMKDMVLTSEDLEETMKQDFISEYDKELLEFALKCIKDGRLVYLWACW
nr:MAG TPA: hypothetical protein [Caudoviricetes sp.]